MKARLKESEKTMIRSCHIYGYTWLKNNRYLQPIINRVGIDRVKREFETLGKNYTIQSSVYTDSEGVSYNALIKS